jgi:hypothetical protein
MTRKRVSENPAVVSTGGTAPVRRKSVSSKRVSRPTVVEVSDTPVTESEVLSVSTAVASEAPAESYQDAVARLAYSYWEARGYQGGSPEADWLRAEQELLAK